MKIAIAADHAGYEEKEQLKPLLDELGVQYEDLGTASPESVDYPNYARKVAEEVASGHVDQGLLVCGSGTGMAIVANKVPGVRAAVAWTPEVAALAREHNDANVLSLGARVTPAEELPKIVRAWFNAKFEGGRHERRVEQIRAIEKEEVARCVAKYSLSAAAVGSGDGCLEFEDTFSLHPTLPTSLSLTDKKRAVAASLCRRTPKWET